MVKYAVLERSLKSAILLPILGRARRALPRLFALLGSHYTLSDVLSCSPIMSSIGVTCSDPLWHDFTSFNDRLSDDLLELIEDLPDAPGSVRQKLTVLITDQEAEAQLKRSKGTTAVAGDTPITFYSATVPPEQAPTLNKLRRSSELRVVMQSFNDGLNEDDIDRLEMLEVGCRSRISSIYKLTIGLLGTLDFGDCYSPIIGLLSGQRISKLKHGKVRPLAEYLWSSVFKQHFSKYPKLEDARFAEQFTIQFAGGNSWKKIDFEQRLVLDPNLVKHGAQDVDFTFNRPRTVWFQDGSLLRKLIRPLKLLMKSIGYSSTEGSFKTAIELTLRGFDYAEEQPTCAHSVKGKAVNALHLAIEDAMDSYTNFLSDSSPWAPFPLCHIPKASRYANELKRSIISTDSVINMAAGCKEFYQVLMAQAAKNADDSAVDGRPLAKKKKAIRDPLAQPALKAPTKKLAAVPAPGSRVQDLEVRLSRSEGYVEIAGSRWDLNKIRPLLGGKTVCWPCLVTRQRHADVVCLEHTKPGHIRGGDDRFHRSIDPKLRDHVLSNFNEFGIYVEKRWKTKGGGQKRPAQLALALDQSNHGQALEHDQGNVPP